MHQKRKSKEIYTLKALLDSGVTATLINSKFVKYMQRHKRAPTSWVIQNGTQQIINLCFTVFSFVLPLCFTAPLFYHWLWALVKQAMDIFNTVLRHTRTNPTPISLWFLCFTTRHVTWEHMQYQFPSDSFVLPLT